MRRARDAAVLPFGGTAHIEKLQSIPRRLQLVNGHLLQLAERITGILPGPHSADEIPGELRVAGPDKKLRYFFHIAVAFEDKQDGLFRIEQPAGPDRED